MVALKGTNKNITPPWKNFEHFVSAVLFPSAFSGQYNKLELICFILRILFAGNQSTDKYGTGIRS